jgi:N-methylhydantoinase A
VKQRPVFIGVDVGGTFTDIVSFDTRTGELVVHKSLTPSDPSASVHAGLKALGADPGRVSMVSHATTLATNSLLTHAGLGRTALVTNDGFRDIVEIGRQRRPELYDLGTARPVPLVERKNRFTVSCRMLADGTEFEPLDRRAADSIAEKVSTGTYDSVAVSFLNSYLSDTHEVQMRDALLRAGFRGHISISSEVDREYREYERTSTTVVNAALSPPVTGYLSRLSSSLRTATPGAHIYVMGSDGGASTVDFASRMPITILESGPAAGVIAAAHLARQLALDKVLTFDMGGTTAKAGAVLDFEPSLVNEFEAAGRTHSGRSIKGSGYPVRGQFIDLAEVSAGGGTVAWLDEAGGLRAGPRSAGSEPGPACYGRGGTQPTVTDANVILGRLNPKALLGGAMPIHRGLAFRSVRPIAASLGESANELSKGFLKLVNNSMAKAISIVSVERGLDPREFTMLAFGGAGPVHACDLAEDLGARNILVPVHAGLFSAYGLLVGEFTRTFAIPVMKADPPLETVFRDLEDSVRREMRAEGFNAFTLKKYVEARYEGQSHEIPLPYHGNSSLRKSFDSRHKALYGYSSTDRMQVVNARIRAKVPRPSPGNLTSGWTPSKSKPTTRKAWLGGVTRQVEVLTRESIHPGAGGRGPCIIEEYDSTLVVNPSWSWRTDEYGTRLTR